MQKLSGVAAADAQTILDNVKELSNDFAGERKERQHRRELVRADFDRLHRAGFTLTAVPVEHGGIWESDFQTLRWVCEILRNLAHGDSSVALVASMHPAVILSCAWLSIPEAPEPFAEAWKQQRQWAFQTARDGHFWGTIISEPGSGGDNSRSGSIAQRGSSDGEYLINGQKHFGSGSGITSYVITNAVPEGESEPDVFVMDLRDTPFDGSSGVQLTAPWDGHGMTATQSHAMSFNDYPAARLAIPARERAALQADSERPVGALFVAVVVGVVETAIETARQQLQRKRDSLRPYERVEWSKVELEGWLIQQAYDGMLRAIDEDRDKVRNSLLAKEAVAELSESVLSRICKIIGGSAYSRSSPYGFWLQDVRALGFLRPPWGLAFDRINDGTWNP